VEKPIFLLTVTGSTMAPFTKAMMPELIVEAEAESILSESFPNHMQKYRFFVIFCV
jgi:hypothetical protein